MLGACSTVDDLGDAISKAASAANPINWFDKDEKKITTGENAEAHLRNAWQAENKIIQKLVVGVHILDDDSQVEICLAAGCKTLQDLRMSPDFLNEILDIFLFVAREGNQRH